MRHVYSMIRFVPDPASGEFINVGALVGCDTSSEWGYRQIDNTKRARDLGSTEALNAVWSFMDRLGEQIDRYDDSLESLFEAETELNEDWLERLYNMHRNIVQLSPPTPLVAESVDDALDLVFDLMIHKPSRQRRGGHHKYKILAAGRQAYRDYSIASPEFCERVKLSSAHHFEQFDFAVTNGSTLQMVQAWSFQAVDLIHLSRRIKSWGWTVRSTRDNGGSITTRDGETYVVKNDVPIEVVYLPPESDQEMAVFQEGESVFEALNINPVPVGDVNLVAERARSLLADAGVKTGLIEAEQ